MEVKMVIKSFNLDLSYLPATSERREFSITGDEGAEFKLEIRDNTTNYYYNFVTNIFQANVSSLEDKLSTFDYNGEVVFPAITGSSDQYDIYLFAKPNTKHNTYIESRFADGSLDINGSSGSNSLMLQKVIHQYVDQTLTILPYSVGGTIEAASVVNNVITFPKGSTVDKQAFTIACSVSTATKCYRIIKQPTSSDVLAFVEPAIGAAPINIQGENIYPTATAAFTGDDINGAITSGAVVRMDNTDLSAVIKVGDKITTPVVTDTVNGDFSGGATAITMDSAVATKMAVGDQVTGNAALDAGLFTVASIDSTNVFSLNASAAIDDGATLTFSSKINRSLTTVTVVETSGTATDFTMSQAIQFRDNTPLTFFNQKNYRWPIDNFANTLAENMVLFPGTNVTVDSLVSKYQDTVTTFPGTEQEVIIVKKEVPAVDTLSIKPVITKGVVSTQAGAVVFNKQQDLVLASDTVQIGGYGNRVIKLVCGYDVIFSDLAVALTPVVTTTTGAVSNSTSVPVTSRNGILDDVSTVSGIGINPALTDPTVDTGAGAVSGAGTLVLTAAQTLEDGATLTFSGAGQTATITGNVQILKAGEGNETLRFDIDKLLSIT
tara:strand:- start:17 stop:1834 length:1818 start_codon:yes stop_codon:yes gene_type:complete